ncbi:DUF58 domain-containing protein [Macrococcus lamae]
MFRRSKKVPIVGQVFIDQNAQLKMRLIIFLMIIAVIVMLLTDHFVIALILMIIILMIILENRENYRLIRSIKIEDDRHHIYPVVGKWFNYTIYIRSLEHVNTTMTLHLSISNGSHYFSNHQGSMSYTLAATGISKIDIPIFIQERGAFQIIIQNIHLPGQFHIQQVNFEPKTYLSRLYASYGNFEMRSIDQHAVDEVSNRTEHGDSMEKFSNSLYDYTQPFNQLDWPATLKSQALLVKQTEIAVNHAVILSLNVGNYNTVNASIESDLRELAHFALTLYDQGNPFYIGINTISYITSNESPILYINQEIMKDELHRLIATFSRDSYILPYTSLIQTMTEQIHENGVWYHFGPAEQSVKDMFNRCLISPVYMEVSE